MSELLTTKQLKELLKVDRITIYRMLNDGRLKGVKIGNQWRFPPGEIARLLGEEKNVINQEESNATLSDFPVDCVQHLQTIFAGIVGIGAVTTNLEGDALTEPTYTNPFCKLMLSSPSGRKACQASWRKIALKMTGKPPFHVCHAGLSYAGAVINTDDQPVAWFVAGQFYLTPPDPGQEKERLEQLADRHAIPLAQLAESAKKIPVLKVHQQEQVQEWTPKVADTVSSFLCERSDLLNRLQRISMISSIRPTAPK